MTECNPAAARRRARPWVACIELAPLVFSALASGCASDSEQKPAGAAAGASGAPAQAGSSAAGAGASAASAGRGGSSASSGGSVSEAGAGVNGRAKGGSGAASDGGFGGAGVGGAGIDGTGIGGTNGLDACPDDPAKTAPGVCGCGVSEACARLKEALTHRYEFKGNGAAAEDSVGMADGTVVGTMLNGSGSLALSGNDQFVDLPNGLLSRLQSATLEAWATVGAGIGAYSHIMDFGSSTGTEGSQSSGRSFFFLAPGSNSSDVMRAAISLNGSSGESIIDAPFIAAGTLTHMAVVFDDAARTMLMYRDGALKGSVVISISLGMIADVNNWLGRSQFASDADFRGNIAEFRIYSAALTASELALSATHGPDPAFLLP